MLAKILLRGGFLCLLPLCDAIAFPGPVITPAPKVDTSAFERALVHQHRVQPFEEFAITQAPQLEIRQEASDGSIVGFEAPDNTCGFVEGRSGAGVGCAAGLRCRVEWDPSSTKKGTPACCEADGGQCAFQMTCIHSRDMGVRCDAGCRADSDTLQCTATDAPYCHSFLFTEFGSATAYLCSNTPQYTSGGIPTLKTSIDFNTDLRRWHVLSYVPTSSGASSSSAEPTPTAPAFSPISTSSPGGRGPPVAAMVGGIVGGIIGLCALGTLAFVIHRKASNRNAYRGNEGNPHYVAYDDKMPKPPPPPSFRTNASDYYPTSHLAVDYERSGNMSPISSTAPAMSPTISERRTSENQWVAPAVVHSRQVPHVPQPAYSPARNPAYGTDAHELVA